MVHWDLDLGVWQSSRCRHSRARNKGSASNQGLTHDVGTSNKFCNKWHLRERNPCFRQCLGDRFHAPWVSTSLLHLSYLLSLVIPTSTRS